MKTICYVLVGLVLSFLTSSFYYLSFDIVAWGTNGRGACLFMMLVATFMAVVGSKGSFNV